MDDVGNNFLCPLDIHKPPSGHRRRGCINRGYRDVCGIDVATHALLAENFWLAIAYVFPPLLSRICCAKVVLRPTQRSMWRLWFWSACSEAVRSSRVPSRKAVPLTKFGVGATIARWIYEPQLGQKPRSRFLVLQPQPPHIHLAFSDSTYYCGHISARLPVFVVASA